VSAPQGHRQRDSDFLLAPLPVLFDSPWTRLSEMPIPARAAAGSISTTLSVTTVTVSGAGPSCSTQADSELEALHEELAVGGVTVFLPVVHTSQPHATATVTQATA
jgi:hypothetical protein